MTTYRISAPALERHAGPGFVGDAAVLTAGQPMPEQTGGAQAVWRQVVAHINGTAIGNLVHTLAVTGVLEALARSPAALSADALAADHGLVAGYCHLAFQLLEDEGLVWRAGEPAAGTARVGLTASGRAWVPLTAAYRDFPAQVTAALALPAAWDGSADAQALVLAALSDLDPVAGGRSPHAQGAPGDLTARVREHRRGPLVAALMHECLQRGLFTTATGPGGPWVPLTRCGSAPGFIGAALHLLAGPGWLRWRPDAVALTAAGRLAAQMAVQYAYPVCYLPTIAAMPARLRGLPPTAPPAPGSAETHVDRRLDIAFSGRVFDALCREPFLELACALFDHTDYGRQPTAVVDCGAGDGTVLLALYQAVRERTARGRVLDTYPLTLVGAEYNAVARHTCEARLAAAGVPQRTLFGDIADPEALLKGLASLGIDPLAVLHVNKSVLHNRGFIAPSPDTAPPAPPHSGAVFLRPDGGLITGRDLERNLLECLRRWRPAMRRHGLLTIAAHRVPAALAAHHHTRSLFTAMDATHGFSHQYLIEYDRYLVIAHEAGLISGPGRCFGGSPAGAPTLSLHHWRTRD